MPDGFDSRRRTPIARILPNASTRANAICRLSNRPTGLRTLAFSQPLTLKEANMKPIHLTREQELALFGATTKRRWFWGILEFVGAFAAAFCIVAALIITLAP